MTFFRDVCHLGTHDVYVQIDGAFCTKLTALSLSIYLVIYFVFHVLFCASFIRYSRPSLIFLGAHVYFPSSSSRTLRLARRAAPLSVCRRAGRKGRLEPHINQIVIIAVASCLNELQHGRSRAPDQDLCAMLQGAIPHRRGAINGEIWYNRCSLRVEHSGQKNRTAMDQQKRRQAS